MIQVVLSDVIYLVLRHVLRVVKLVAILVVKDNVIDYVYQHL